MNATKKLTLFAFAISGAFFSQNVRAQSSEAMELNSSLLRTQSTYTWAALDSQSLPARMAERVQIANLMYRLGAQERLVDRAFDLSQQSNLPQSLRYYREGQWFGRSYIDTSTRDINELKHTQITWLSRLLYTNNPESLKSLMEKIGPVIVELIDKPHNFTVHVNDDQYAGGDNGRRQTTLYPEVIGNLVHLLDRLEIEPKLAPMKAELRNQAMAILNHPKTVDYFVSSLSGGLLDGYSESGIYLRRYFELVQVAQPGIWKSVVAKVEANPDMLPTSLLVLKYWTTRDLKYFRQLLAHSRWIHSEVFSRGIPGYEPFQILRSNPELLELTVLRALEGMSPVNRYTGSILPSAVASAQIEKATKEHRLVQGIRDRLPNADHAHRAIGNLFLAAGLEGRIYLGPYGGVSVNQRLLQIAMQEAKKQGIDKVDVKLLFNAARDFSTTKAESDFLRNLRHLFGNEKIDSIVRSAFAAGPDLVARQPMMNGRDRYGQGADASFMDSFRRNVRAGALVEMLARQALTLQDVDMIFKDLASGTKWLNSLSSAYDFSVLSTLKETIRELLKSNGYGGGQGFARYLRERHGLSIALTAKDATSLQAHEHNRGTNTPKLIQNFYSQGAKLTTAAGDKSLNLLEGLAMAGYLSINGQSKTSGELYIGISDNRYNPEIGQIQIRETNSFILETYANWMRVTGHSPPVVIERQMSLRAAAASVKVLLLGCEGAFISTK